MLMRRLLSLDYIIERPTLGWLPTEADKVQRFEAFGIDRGTLPYRKYGKADKAQPRYFALKLPIAVDAPTATFVYVDPGQTTDSELRAWGAAHAPLWAALRARTFAVPVVAVGVGAEAADRAAGPAPQITTPAVCRAPSGSSSSTAPPRRASRRDRRVRPAHSPAVASSRS